MSPTDIHWEIYRTWLPGWYLQPGTGDMSWSLDFQIPPTGIKSSIPRWDMFYFSYRNEAAWKLLLLSVTVSFFPQIFNQCGR